VPRYIPSPPPSPPPSSPVSPFTQLSVSLGSAISNEMPPLPMDWKETIERAVGNDNVWPRSPVVDTGVSLTSPSLCGQVFNIPPIVVTDGDHLGEVDLGEMRRHTEYQPETRQPRLKLINRPASVSPGFQSSSSFSAPISPTTYRPPTPPLRSGNKRVRRSDSPISCLIKPGELVYPDLVGLGESDSTRIAATNSESSTFVYGTSGSNLARHTLPPSLASWLSLKPGSFDTATLVDEELSLPSYYSRKPLTDSMTVVSDLSPPLGVWQTIKSWTKVVVTKVKDFGASAVSFWSSMFV